MHINIAVINNGFLGMVRQWQEAFYEKNYSGFADPLAGLRQAGWRLMGLMARM